MATDPNSTDGRKTRKVAVRPGKRVPGRSEGNRRRYQDPAQREHRRQLMLQTIARYPGKWGRPLGSYDGIPKAERIRINEEAAAFAKRIIAKMEENGIIKPDDDPRAVEALAAAVEVMRTPTNQGTKLQAAKLILEYTKSKPATEAKVTVNKAEEWLASIAEDDESDEDPVTADDAETPA